MNPGCRIQREISGYGTFQYGRTGKTSPKNKSQAGNYKTAINDYIEEQKKNYSNM